MAAFALAVARSRAAPPVKWVTLALSVCVVCWMSSESASMWAAMGRPFAVQVIGFLASGAFWLFVQVIFEDRPLRPWAALPLIILAAMGVAIEVLPPRPSNLVGAAFNAFSGVLALHVVYVIARGWRGDLVEGRRRARATLFDPPRRVDPRQDVRADAAERHLLDKLEGFVVAEGWRREGLTIGDLATELETPEHRLRG